MEEIQKFRQRILQINENNFDPIALELFKFQAVYNPVYRDYLSFINVKPEKIHDVSEIPFLPIRFFKSHQVKTGVWTAEKIFHSSGTTVTGHAAHHLDDLNFYTAHARKFFEKIFGSLKNLNFLAVLPSYQERDDSSLVYMADNFIRNTDCDLSGFYLNDYEKLSIVLELCRKQHKPTFLLGVTFALLDLIQQGIDFSGVVVMETGGMKGRRQELTRRHVHQQLCEAFGVLKIHSEYGMTELLSQAYSKVDALFKTPPWMKILIREINDPMKYCKDGQTGGINIIDLANINSCSFISTQDLGRVKKNGFEILGRFDHSEARGCNLMTLTE